MQPAERPEEASVVIVNTCGFLQSSRAESLETLRALGQGKQAGQLLIASGCLISRYGEVVKTEVPEVDGVIDAGKWLAMPRLIEWLSNGGEDKGDWFDEAYLNLPPDQIGARSVTEFLPRRSSGPTAFLKIADGCDRPCTFCIIPAIKGMHRSKPVEQVLAEAQQLVRQGTRELVLVAQDTTAYGWDWGQRDAFAPLLEQLVSEVEGLEWVRLMYAYPGHVTPRLIETMARHPQILHYLDIPLQHAHPQVLQRMKRPNIVVTRRLLDDLRKAMPDIAIRTTFIVGFPGETEEEFESLLEFLEEQQFDRVGVFEFSREEGTPAAAMPNQVPHKTKVRRRNQAMEVQQSISLAKNQKLVGSTLSVLIEEPGEMEMTSPRRNRPPERELVSLGRSYRDAPEVDGMVIVRDQLLPGELVRVRITQATEYDLIGVPEKQLALQAV